MKGVSPNKNYNSILFLIYTSLFDLQFKTQQLIYCFGINIRYNTSIFVYCVVINNNHWPQKNWSNGQHFYKEGRG